MIVKIDPESNEGVINAIDQLLAKNDLGVIALEDGWGVVKFTSFTHDLWDTLETRSTRGDAYQAALSLNKPS